MAQDSEKTSYNVEGLEAAAPDHERRRTVELKDAALGEAADIYGNAQTAEEYGYVERGLKSRHIQVSGCRC
jgi:amino acid transporter